MKASRHRPIHISFSPTHAGVVAPTDPGIVQLLNSIDDSKSIVALVGAGISVSAGIPDFRSKNGLNKNHQDLLCAPVHSHDEKLHRFHRFIVSLARLCDNALPTKFHRLLAEWADERRLQRLYTQNIDALEQRFDSLKVDAQLTELASAKQWPTTVYMHGRVDQTRCMSCPAVTKLLPGDLPAEYLADCTACKERTRAANGAREMSRKGSAGKKRPNILLYNESSPEGVPEALRQLIKIDKCARPDLLIVAGTSLNVQDAMTATRELCARARTAIWLNIAEPPSDTKGYWDYVLSAETDVFAAQVKLDFLRRRIAAARPSEGPTQEYHEAIMHEICRPQWRR